ncbi:NUDIX domain-containing protein [Timonella sp. A28]|uniref:NUDIX domain-containing protein n=1 Tax=Timonella sp. A28 TaxID=3442640 RepID=UPI003EBCAE4B
MSDSSRPTPPSAHVRMPGDGWVNCRCGNKHWGLNGAAGLFLARKNSRGEWSDVVLQHRALWSHQGGTWGIPGGALMDGETAHDAAVREAHEEAGIDKAHVVRLGSHVFSHADWSYTTIIAESTDPHMRVHPTDAESLEIQWVPLTNIVAALNSQHPDLRLLPAFAHAFPSLYAVLKNSTH